MITGEVVLGVLGLGAAGAIIGTPGLRRLPAVARHPRARVAISATFGLLYLVAAVAGRNDLAPLTGALLVCSLVLLLIERARPVRR